MDKLIEPIELDTGLERGGAPVTVTLAPGKGGGSLVFKMGAKRKKIPLAQILANIVEARPPGVVAADWVELGELEHKVAIGAAEIGDGENDRKLTYLAKTLLWNLVRDARDDRREDRGLEPVSWGRRNPTQE